jgi:crotonobetainyl-CoA:carnitine CoA-transferase CaiB-like acyl-CoA transferase
VAHVEEIDAAVAQWIGARPRDEVLAAFEAAEAAIAPIYDARDILADLHFQARETIASVEGVKMTNVVSRLSDTPGEIRWAGRSPGVDTDAVLGELGLTPEEIRALREQGVV